MPLALRVDASSWPRACAGAHECVRGQDHCLVRALGCTDTIELVRANYLQLWARETVPFRFFGNITGLRLMSLPGHRVFAPFRVPLTPPALVGMSVATNNIIVSRRDTGATSAFANSSSRTRCLPGSCSSSSRLPGTLRRAGWLTTHRAYSTTLQNVVGF